MSILPARTILAIAAVADVATHHLHEAVKGGEIAERLEVSQRRLEASLQALAAAGILHSRRGRDGGYRLKKQPSEITFAAIVEVIATMSNTGEAQQAPVAARVERMVETLAHSFRGHLAEYTIADVLASWRPPTSVRRVPRGVTAP